MLQAKPVAPLIDIAADIGIFRVPDTGLVLITDDAGKIQSPVLDIIFGEPDGAEGNLFLPPSHRV